MLNKELYEVTFQGIKATGDMALFNKQQPIILSLYGSESQLRGIFSSLATNNEITLQTDTAFYNLTRGWEGHLRFKSFRIGYGKYHALIWNEQLISETIMVMEKGEEQKAWENFLKSRKVPIKREWIPEIIAILKREDLIETLVGVNLKGWHWTAQDNAVCDLIVEEIYK